MFTPDPLKWTEVVSALSTASAVLISLGGAFIAWRALRWNKDAVSETKRSADAAQKSAEAALKQVELQRPRPVVVAIYKKSLGTLSDNSSIRLRNIGDSPAFDVEVDRLRVPGTNEPVLLSFRIPYILPNSEEDLNQELVPDDVPVSPGMSAFSSFVILLHQHFNQAERPLSPPDWIPMIVRYRRFDGYEGPPIKHRLVIDRRVGLNQVRLELDQSLVARD